MTNKGMLSIVEHKEDANWLIVRARDRKTLEELLPEHEIITLLNADYRFRVEVSREGMAQLAGWLVSNIDYENFKKSVEDDELHEAYLSCWSVMLRYQNNTAGPYSWHMDYGINPAYDHRPELQDQVNAQILFDEGYLDDGLTDEQK
jgi:hypothetical protein